MLIRSTGMAKEMEIRKAFFHSVISRVLAKDSSWALLSSLSATSALYPRPSMASTMARRPMALG